MCVVKLLISQQHGGPGLRRRTPVSGRVGEITHDSIILPVVSHNPHLQSRSKDLLSGLSQWNASSHRFAKVLTQTASG